MALRWGKLFVCILLSILFILPIFVTIISSFMPTGEINANYFIGTASDQYYLYLRLLPQRVSLEQYKEILILSPTYLLRFWNSVFIVAPILFGHIIVSCLTSYGLYRMNNRLAHFIILVYTIVMVLPYQATCVPNFMVIHFLGLMDTRTALVLPGVFGPFGTFLLYQFFCNIPKNYLESAQLDGAGEFRTFLYIVLPLIRNGISALAIISFVDYWNMVEQPLIYLQSSSKEPLSVFLSQLLTDSAGIIFAASTFYMLPAVLFFLRLESEFVQGVQLSGIK